MILLLDATKVSVIIITLQLVDLLKWINLSGSITMMFQPARKPETANINFLDKVDEYMSKQGAGPKTTNFTLHNTQVLYQSDNS